MTRIDPMPLIDTDTMLTVTEVALDMCRKIRRDMRWTGTMAESAREHAFILADLERNFLPRCEAHTARLVRAAINAEREAFAQ